MITQLDWLSLAAIVLILSSGVAIELAYHLRLERSPSGMIILAIFSSFLFIGLALLVRLFN